MNRAVTLLGVALSSVCISAGYAAVSFQPQPANLTLAPGQTGTIQLYLYDDGSTLSSEQGLYSIGFRITRTGSGASAIVGFTPNAAQFPVAASTPYTVTPSEITYWYEVADSASQGILPQNHLISLGSIQVQGAGGVDTEFTFGDYGPGTQSLTWSLSGTFEDSQIAPATFTVAVPEPASLSLLGLAGVLVLRRRSR